MKAGPISTSQNETYVLLAAVAVGAFLLWKGVKAAGGAVVDTAAAAAGGAAHAAVGIVGAVGAAVGLPTPSQTIDDPLVVRWICDHVGSFTASKWGTADAFMAAMWLPEGAGDRYPPDAATLAALGVAPSVPIPATSGKVLDFTAGAGSVPGIGGPSFNDVASGKTDPYNPLAGNGW